MTIDKKEKKVIVFDLGGVILPLCHDTMLRQFKLLNPRIDDSVIMSFYTNELTQHFEVGGMTKQDYLQYLQQHYFKGIQLPRITKAITCFLGSVSRKSIHVLEKIRLLCDDLCLLSNTNPIHVDAYEENFFLQHRLLPCDLFDYVFYSYEMGLRKPDPAIYQHVLEICQCCPENVLFIDDNKENIAAARLMGIKTIHYPHNEPLDDDFYSSIQQQWSLLVD